MSVDSLIPIAPAKVKALVVPLGQIKRERFDAFVDRLHDESIVHLRDITPDGRPNRSTEPDPFQSWEETSPCGHADVAGA